MEAKERKGLDGPDKHTQEDFFGIDTESPVGQRAAFPQHHTANFEQRATLAKHHAALVEQQVAGQ